MLTRQLCLLALFFLLLGPPLAGARTQPSGQYTYTAQLAHNTPVTGLVDANGITWRCAGRSCETTGPWPAPAVLGCVALAIRVGPIASYGRAGLGLGPLQVLQCNTMAHSRAQTAGAQAPAIAPAGVSARTATLALTGTGALAERGAISAIAVRTEALTLTGVGALAARGPFSPTRARTQVLTLTGTAPVVRK